MLIYIPINDQMKFTKISICFIVILYILWSVLKQLNISLFWRPNLF